MNNFKEVLEQAIQLHNDIRKEKVSELGVAVMLWSASSPKTQYEMLRQAKQKTVEELDLKSSKVNILRDLLPDTHPDTWTNNKAQRYFIEKFVNRYRLDIIDANHELQILWERLNDGKLDVNLINKYLI